ncbi:amidohydrolase family protein [Arcicella sp. LKC2W]|uniref:amidohydrolase family protein n=1 Tax=Arcicella sp. LKC2W TaxID=2984198 RepID=UPI002B1EC23A|nr:amidohydrolase family protein [Arcicella sp. LKC2W]MEA5457638.1 amidohydrolase family protein [Arcicella sp. LKC2W]
MKNLQYIYIVVFVFISNTIFAQNQAAGNPQAKAIALVGATIHTANGQVIANGVIVFNKGIITAVGAAGTAYDKVTTETIDVAGKSIYPGLISPVNSLGLVEIEAVRSTNDLSEIGGINPHVRSLIAYNTDSELIPTVRSNGILITQPTPQGEIIGGMSSVMQMDGWNWEDAVLKKDDGIHLNWIGYFKREFDFAAGTASTKRNDKRDDMVRELDKTFNDAIAYAQVKNPATINVKLEAMKGLFDGSKNLYISADYGKEIIEAVQFAKSKGVKKIVIIGAEEALLAADFLKENNVSVIVSSTHRLPNNVDDDTDIAYKLPQLLSQKGILVGLAYIGLNWRTRNLPFLAGTVAGHGMDKEEALKLITANNAKILGIDKMVGTLEVGKHATLIVSAGDALDMRTAKIEQAFIQGRKVDLDDKQKRLYRKYSEKYGTK